MSYRKKHFPPKEDKQIEQENIFPPEYTNPGVLRVLPTSKLISGLGYQRPVVASEVKRLVEKWDNNLLDPLTVSFRDGHFYVVDGQHRVSALREISDGDVLVLCRIYTGLTYEQEAELCVKLDRAKKRMSLAQSTHALLESGADPRLKQINRLLNFEGFTWALGKKRGGDYEITITQAVISAYELLGSAAFSRMMWLFENTWHGDPSSLCAVMFAGMALFVKTYEPVMNDHTFVQRLSVVSPEEIIRRSKSDFSTNSNSLRCAKVLWNKYNSGRRGDRKLQYLFKG